MTTSDADDPIVRRLRRLAAREPDAARAERVRGRGRAMLAQRQQAASGPAAGRRTKTPVLDYAVIGALSVTYLLAIVHDLLRLAGRW